MKKLFGIILTLFATLSFAETTFQMDEGRLVGTLEWTQGPIVADASRFDLSFSSSSLDLTKHSVRVDLWMPSMGHGSAPVTLTKVSRSATKLELDVTDVYFVMPGDWQVRVFVDLDNGTTLKHNIDLDL